MSKKKFPGWVVICLLALTTGFAENSWKTIEGFPATTINKTLTLSNGTILVTTDGNGIYKSTDNAVTWTKCSGVPSEVRGIIEDNQGTVLCGTHLDGIYRSTDHGATWKQSNTGLNRMNVRSFIQDKDNAIFCGIDMQYIFKSTDDGQSWAMACSSKGESAFDYLAIDKSNDYLYAGTGTGTGSGCYLSKDKGKTWDRIDLGFQDKSAHRVFADSKGVLYVSNLSSTTVYGVKVSADHGKTWNAYNIPAFCFYFPSEIKTFIGSAGVLNSTDNLASTRSVGTGFPQNVYVNDMTITKEGKLLVCTKSNTLMILDDPLPVKFYGNSRISQTTVVANSTSLMLHNRKNSSVNDIDRQYSITGQCTGYTTDLSSGIFVKKTSLHK